MTGALMLVSHVSDNGSGITTSAEFVRSYSERSHVAGVTVVGSYSDAYVPNANAVITDKRTVISRCVCLNCSGLSTLGFSNPTQAFIFAFGTARGWRSDDLDAPLKRHEHYWHCRVDTTQAASHGSGRAAAPNPREIPVLLDIVFVDLQASHSLGTGDSRDAVLAVLEVVMSVAFVPSFAIAASRE